MKKIYEVDGTHWTGPRGINEAFVVYSIPDKALQRLQNEGLEYLKNLDSTTEGLYKGWQAGQTHEHKTVTYQAGIG